MSLTDAEKVAYLANLYAVARADGLVSPNEVQAIESAQKRIRARKALLSKADTAASETDFSPSLVGPLSVRVANLEDMVVVSLVDGALDDAEKPLVAAFAKKVGITNDQLKMIVSEAKQRISSTDAKRACPNCSSPVPRTSKFCPECGVSLEESDKAAAVPVSYDIPHTGITIEFAESTASGFADGLRRAKAAPVHAECVKGKKTWYMASWLKEQVMEAAKLASDLKGMRNRKVWVDGEESRWDEVFGFTWCSDERESAYRPDEYCFGLADKRLNIWGCKNARMDWSQWASWLSYGEFKKAGLLEGRHVFAFDKKRIRHELENNLFHFRFCPYLDFPHIEAVLDVLPDEVEVTPNGEWAYKQDYSESPGSIRVRAKLTEGGFEYESEFFSSGVVPKSVSVGLDLLKKAVKASSGSQKNIKGVLAYRGDM